MQKNWTERKVTHDSTLLCRLPACLTLSSCSKINQPTQCSIIKWDGLPPQISSVFERTTHKEKCAVLLYNAIFVTHARLLRMKTANNDNLHSVNDAVHQMINMHRLLTISTNAQNFPQLTGEVTFAIACLLSSSLLFACCGGYNIQLSEHEVTTCVNFSSSRPHDNRSRKLKQWCADRVFCRH